MGKFAGFLKRAKQMFHNGVKGIKTLKDIWNTVITKPGTAILNAVLPETKPLTDILYTVDNYINKGFDWVINKTGDSSQKQIEQQTYNNMINGIKDILDEFKPKKPVSNVGPGGINPNGAIRINNRDRTYLNFNK